MNWCNQVLRKLIVGICGILVLTGCLGVGVYDPQATEVAFQSTFVAMEEKLAGLETAVAAQADATTVPEQPSATPSFTPTNPPFTPSPAPTKTPSPLPKTATPTATPTETRASTSQGETIVLATATSPPQPTATSTLRPTLSATEVPPTEASPTATAEPTDEGALRFETPPIILEPGDGITIEETRNTLMRWEWPNELAENQHFDIKIKPEGGDESIYVTWVDEPTLDWWANLPPGRYFWSVQVIQGYYENNSGDPEDRVFEAFLSPESEWQLITISKKPPPTSTPSP